LIDMIGPVEELRALRRRPQRVVTDLHEPLGMYVDLRAELACEHLCAETDAEERLVFSERHFDPVRLRTHIVVGVVCAHRPAEDDDAGVLFERLRQRIAEAW